MVLPTVLLRIAVRWLLSCYGAAKKLRNYGFHLLYRSSASVAARSQQPTAYPCVDKFLLQGRASQTVVFDVDNALLRSPSFFPFFMLVAFEGGSVLRALLLLLCYPLVWALGCCGATQMGLRLMAFVTFCGLRRRDAETAARAVLPKFYLEDLHPHAYEAVKLAGRKVAVTAAPRVMVEWFLREYLGVDDVAGADLGVFTGGCRFTGLFSTPGAVNKSKAVKELLGGDAKPDLGLAGGSDPDGHLFLSLCKEAYVMNKEGRSKVGTGAASSAMAVPRKRYPKPLVFHDGRLAFLPTPSASLALFLWLPFSVPLAIVRLLAAITLPSGVAIFVGACLGNSLRVTGLHLTDNRYVPHRGDGEESRPTAPEEEGGGRRRRGVLYVCTHRTLLDPVVLSITLGKPLTAVTYSLSKVSEVLSPIPTVRLCREREQDGKTMQRLLGEGDLVVCPEGTTCREPYLLRFSPLFAELTDEIVPVGMDAEVATFHGTTAGGYKWMDPFFFLMNPHTAYRVHVLGRLLREATCSSGRSSRDVANDIQRRLADRLGFECTTLTRRDKYLVLAGNDGVVSSVVPPAPAVALPPAPDPVPADGAGSGRGSGETDGNRRHQWQERGDYINPGC